MRKSFFAVALVLILITSLFASGCTSKTSTTSPSTSVPPTQVTTSKPSSTVLPTSSAPPTQTTSPTSTPPQTSVPVTAKPANWWDKLGEPKYGGTFTQALANIPSGFDPYNWQQGQNSLWFEALWNPDWTIDPSTRIFAHMWVPAEYWTGNLAEKWEWPDAKTLVVHLRQGVKWQNKPPVNGREFNADDVIFHFDRMMGTGSGFNSPNPFYAGRFTACEKVTAKDKYTVVFHFVKPNIFINSNAIIAEPILQFFEAKEVYEMGGPVMGSEGINSALNDWKNQVGTGPFMLVDWVSGTSMTMNKNPDYWAYDERHPQNKLPYLDSVKFLCIPDQATQIAALRSGKVDIVSEIDWQQAQSLEKTNPNLLKETYASPGSLIQLRCDTPPFTDIRVRKALQMALDLPSIAKNFYGGTVSWKPVGLINPDYKGFAIPYDEWPKELQEEYSYNPVKARALLTEAGYPNGFKTNVMAASAGPGANVQLLEVIKSYFADVSVDMEIRTQGDFFAMMQMIMAKKHDQMVAMGLSDDMPPQMGMRMYISIEPTNGLCQNDSKFDAMVDAVMNASGLDEAKQLARETDMYWLRQHWVVTTFPNVKYVFWQPWIKGYSGQKPDAWSFSTMGKARIWIEK